MSDIATVRTELATVLAKLQAMADPQVKGAAASATMDRVNGPLGPEWINHDAFTIDETARILRLSRNSAFAQAASGKIPTIRLGKRLIVPRRALERMLSAEDGT